MILGKLYQITKNNMDTPITVRNIVNLAIFIMIVFGIYCVAVFINRSYENNYYDGYHAGYEQAMDDCLDKKTTHAFTLNSKEQSFYEECLDVKFKQQ